MSFPVDFISNWSWIDFCGRDNFVVWNKKHHDLDLCFQFVAFQFPILTLLAISSAYYIGALRLYMRRCSRDLKILRIRCLTSLFLVLVPIIKGYVEEMKYPGQLHSVDYTLVAVQSFCWLVHFLYLVTLKNRLGASLRGPMPLGILWSINYIISWMNLHSNYLISKDPDSVLYTSQLPFLFALIDTALQSIYLLTLLPSGQRIPGVRFQTLSSSGSNSDRASLSGMYMRFRDDDERGDLGTAMDGYNWIERLCFTWVNPLLSKGSSGNLNTSEDLFDLPSNLKSEHLSTKILSAVYPMHEDYLRVSLLRALHRCFSVEFYSIGLLKLIGDLAGFCGPLLLKKLVELIENKSEDVSYGYAYAAGLCLTSLVAAFCNAHFNYKMSLVGLKIRGAIVSLIYRKMLSLNKVTLSNVETGEIVNYMSTDTNKIMNSCLSFHSAWSITVEVIIISYLLYLEIGISFLTVIVITFLMLPVSRYTASAIGKFTKAMMLHKDRRLSCISEVLKGIRAIKFHAWENLFIGKVMDFRKDEMKYLSYRKYLDAICVYLWATTPLLVSTSTIATYIYMGHQLTSSVVFSTLALLGMLIIPLNSLPWVLNGLVEAWVSIKRLEKLLQLSDESLREYYDPSAVNSPLQVVKINDADFELGNSNFKLQSINLAVQQGQLIGVIGSVGSGKTSFVLALLAELAKTQGSIQIADYEQGFGYVAQSPWLQRGTIKENIVFGEPPIEHKYRAVVTACALNKDIDSFPGKDHYNIGDGGSGLSGGQRARVSLARAVYKDLPLYIFDDVLSAVDVHVAKHIFKHCICGLLKNKTRIFVTHHVQLLVQADLVVELKDGQIIKKGVPEDVLPNYMEYITDMQLADEETEELPSDKPDFEIDPLSTPSQTLEEEQRVYGSLDWKVYTSYILAAGLCVWMLTIFFVVFMQTTRNLADWWLARWVSTLDNRTNNADNFSEIIPTGFLNYNLPGKTSYYLSIYVGIGAVNSSVALFRAFLFAYGGLVAARVIHNKLLHKVLSAKVVFFDVVSIGHIFNRFSSDVATIDDSLPFILNILVALFFSVLGTVITTVYSLPYVCIIVAPLSILYHYLQATYRSTARELKRLSSLTLSPLYSHFSETIEGLTTIRAFRVASKFKLNNAGWLDANTKTQMCCSAVSQWLALRLQLIGVGLLSAVGILSILRHHLDIVDAGFVGLAISYSLALTSSLGFLVSTLTETEMEMVSVERVNHYLNEQHEGLKGECIIVNPCKNLPFGWPTLGVVSFQKVYFRHREHLTDCLRNISFTTRPGERIGVIGRTGAGKSSIVSALFRLADVTGGKITVDGMDINDVDICVLRSRMGIIPQDPFIFSGTVKSNLDPKGVHSQEELNNVLSRTQLTQVIEAIGGLDAIIKPDSLSAGQNQLLCLARAMLNNAKVICIDEATATLDQETSEVIQKMIRCSFIQSTVITIAHRMKSVFNSDRVLVIGDGRILEFDSPQTLLLRPNSYFSQLLAEDHQ